MRNAGEILASLINQNGYRNIVEIGVFKGTTCKHILRHCQIAQYFLVDPVIHGAFDIDLKKEPVSFMKMTSVEASRFINNKCLDLVYIDANHKYDFVKQDIFKWLPKIRSGGIISGHDYIDGIKNGVSKAVNELFKKESINLETDSSDTNQKIKVWWVYVE